LFLPNEFHFGFIQLKLLTRDLSLARRKKEVSWSRVCIEKEEEANLEIKVIEQQL